MDIHTGNPKNDHIDNWHFVDFFGTFHPILVALKDRDNREPFSFGKPGDDPTGNVLFDVDPIPLFGGNTTTIYIGRSCPVDLFASISRHCCLNSACDRQKPERRVDESIPNHEQEGNYHGSSDGIGRFCFPISVFNLIIEF